MIPKRLQHVISEGMCDAVVSTLVATRVCGVGTLEELADWEPEVIDIEMAGAGAKPHRRTLDAILALAGCARDIRWRTHADIFENVVMAINLRAVYPKMIQAAHPAEVLWALKSLEIINEFDFENPGLDTEVIAYGAVCALYDGMWCMHPELEIFQEEVKRLARSWDDEVCSEVKKGAVALLQKHDDLTQLSASEDVRGVQTAHILATEAYVRDRRARFTKQVSVFRDYLS